MDKATQTRANEITDQIEAVTNLIEWWEEMESVTMESKKGRRKIVEYCKIYKHDKDTLDSHKYAEALTGYHCFPDNIKPFHLLTDEEFNKIRDIVVATLKSKLAYLKAEYTAL